MIDGLSFNNLGLLQEITSLSHDDHMTHIQFFVYRTIIHFSESPNQPVPSRSRWGKMKFSLCIRGTSSKGTMVWATTPCTPTITSRWPWYRHSTRCIVLNSSLRLGEGRVWVWMGCGCGWVWLGWILWV